MDQNLKGYTIAILVADGFEQSELAKPKEALEKAGAKTVIISPAKGKVKGWDHTNWGKKFAVDVDLSQADESQFDALLLPGGVMNPDELRANVEALELVKKFVKANKPIAAICHGPWTLIDANAVKGKNLTSYKSIKTDLINAGAKWADKEVVIDENLVTSRKPDDIPAFSKAFIELIAKTNKK